MLSVTFLRLGPRAEEASETGRMDGGYMQSSTLAVWSTEDVKMRHDGKEPTPQMMSVTGSVWSVKLQ